MMFEENSLQLLIHSLPLLLKSALMTLQIAIVAILIGLGGGILCGIASCRQVQLAGFASFIRAFVWVMRGTPLFVQVLIVYYALPELLGFSLSPFTAGVIALGLNSTAYICEIVRSGINALADGQWQAAYVLGYTRIQTLRSIILPQVMRHILPTLTNELSSLIKETSILMVIGVAELTKMSKDIVARELDPMTIYLAAAALYLLMTSSVALITQNVQKRIPA